MSTSAPHSRAPENQLLRSLYPAELDRLRKLLQPVELEQHAVVFEAGQVMPHVLFVDEGMISVVSTMENGARIEVGTIGNEGVAGLGAILGVLSTPYRYTVQVAGRGRRLSAEALFAELRGDRQLARVLYRYSAAFVTQVMQGVACNGLHSVEQRCCRWLLSTQDRIGSPELAITHDFLAQMLGVRRASVSDVLRPLQERGLIRASRGKVTILDAPALAASSCECYRVIRGEYKRLLG